MRWLRYDPKLHVEVNRESRAVYTHAPGEIAPAGSVAKTRHVHPFHPEVNLDYDRDGNVIGVEIVW